MSNYSKKDFIDLYVSEIELKPEVLEHSEWLMNEMAEFLDNFRKFSPTAQSMFLLDRLFKGTTISFQMENSRFTPEFLNFYENNMSGAENITEDIIKGLNKIFIKDEETKLVRGGEYRTYDAWVGRAGCKKEEARYVAVDEIYIKNLMEQFVMFYNSKNIEDPFIKGSIVHFLFRSIHPFGNGNGRISRILQEQITTDLISKKYNISFTYPLFNLSQNYELTRGNYYENQNNIVFDLGADNYDSWNKWIQYVMNMHDEQLYYISEKLKEDSKVLAKIK